MSDLTDRLRGYVTDGVARGWPDVETTLTDAADLIDTIDALHCRGEVNWSSTPVCCGCGDALWPCPTARLTHRYPDAEAVA